MLARKTGAPIMVFHVGVDRGRTFEKTWDHFLLPMPFARAVILFAPPIFVPKDASVELMDAKHAEMQKELERVRDVAEAWFTQSDEERERHRAEFQKINFPVITRRGVRRVLRGSQFFCRRERR